MGEDWPLATQLALVVGIVLMTGVMLRVTLRRLRAMRETPNSDVRASYARSIQQQSAVRGDVERVMVELEQVARQIQGQIDTRFAKLEAVIRDADNRIEHLTRLTEPPSTPTLDVTVDDQAPPPATPDGSAVTADRNASIIRLADEGLSAREIAARLEQLVGEVELVLALHTTKAQAERASA